MRRAFLREGGGFTRPGSFFFFLVPLFLEVIGSVAAVCIFSDIVDRTKNKISRCLVDLDSIRRHVAHHTCRMAFRGAHPSASLPIPDTLLSLNLQQGDVILLQAVPAEDIHHERRQGASSPRGSAQRQALLQRARGSQVQRAPR